MSVAYAVTQPLEFPHFHRYHRESLCDPGCLESVFVQAWVAADVQGEGVDLKHEGVVKDDGSEVEDAAADAVAAVAAVACSDRSFLLGYKDAALWAYHCPLRHHVCSSSADVWAKD